MNWMIGRQKMEIFFCQVLIVDVLLLFDASRFRVQFPSLVIGQKYVFLVS